MKRFLKTISALGVVAAALTMTGPAHAQSGVKVGLLTCNVASGWGFIFGSSKDLNCTYRPDSGNPDRYTGEISKFGIDIGYTDGGVIVWSVVAPASDVSPGALAGSYAGVTAEASVGAGVGANVLVGGLNKSITLQPLSIEGYKGLNVAAGIGSINLRHTQP